MGFSQELRIKSNKTAPLVELLKQNAIRKSRAMKALMSLSFPAKETPDEYFYKIKTGFIHVNNQKAVCVYGGKGMDKGIG